MVNVGIIGAGRMGRRHIEACLRSGHTVAMIADRNAESLSLARDLAPNALAQESLDLAQSSDLDMVIIATTTTSHAELAMQAIGSGVQRVLIEKPLGRSLSECDRVVSLAAQRGIHVAVNHPYRHMPPFQHLISLVRSEQFGGLSSMHVVGGNGCMAMLLTHFVDLFELMSGEPVDSVEASLPSAIVPNPRGEQYVDFSGTVRGFSASGRRLTVDMGADQGTGMVATIAGPRGICTFDMLTGAMTGQVRESEDRDRSSTQYMFGKHFHEVPHLPIDIIEGARSVIDSLMSGGSYCTLEQGRRYVEVLITAHTASRLNERMMIGSQSVNRDELFPWP